MNTELATLPPVSTVPALGPVDVLKAFLEGRNPRTFAAYDRDLRDFGRFLGAADVRHALDVLFSSSHGQANATALAYKAHLTGRGLKSATVARHLAALRSVVKMARTVGVIVWTLDVASPKAEAYRDTSGPGDLGWRAMLACAKRAAEGGGAKGDKGRRDVALARLLHDLGLRRGEVVALDLADVDLDGGTIAVIGKGRTEKSRLTLPDQTRDALSGWLARRGDEPGPLFIRLDNAAAAPTRLTGSAVHQIIAKLGVDSGLSRPTRPHALRHQGITRALDLTNGNVREVQRFSRHADPRTLLLYDDKRRDLAGDVAKLVAGD